MKAEKLVEVLDDTFANEGDQDTWLQNWAK